jgi:hypothetical protein
MDSFDLFKYLMICIHYFSSKYIFVSFYFIWFYSFIICFLLFIYLLIYFCQFINSSIYVVIASMNIRVIVSIYYG